MKFIGLRFFTIYGIWGRPDMLIFKYLKKSFNKKTFYLNNFGNHSRDFTYIDDIVKSISKLLNVDSFENKYSIFNIGGENAFDLMNYVSVIEGALSLKGTYDFLPMQLGDVEKTEADLQNLRKVIDFAPKTNIKTGIKKFVDWYRKYYDK